MKLVCFDLGGVLVRITLDLREAARRAGLSVADNCPASFADVPEFAEYQAGRMDDSAYAAALGRVLGLSAAEAVAVHNHILIEPYPGTHELVTDLGSVLRTGCLSNTNALHWEEMRGGDRFPHVRQLEIALASHEVRLEKPDPAIFARFEEMAGVNGSDIVFFDDSVVNVRAAAQAGWRSVWINPQGDPAAQIRRALAHDDSGVAPHMFP